MICFRISEVSLFVLQLSWTQQLVLRMGHAQVFIFFILILNAIYNYILFIWYNVDVCFIGIGTGEPCRLAVA